MFRRRYLAQLHRDLDFIEEELQNATELLDAIFPDASYHLYMNQKERVNQLKASADQKKSEIRNISHTMVAHGRYLVARTSNYIRI